MASASAPVALGVGGLAAVLLISGIQGISIGEIFRGNFGQTKNPQGPGSEEGGAGVTEVGKGTNEVAENIPKGLISPLPAGHQISWQRSDQGIDGIISPGTPMVAMGDGTVEIAHDPNGFGSNYPVLHIDGDGAFYYGHSVPAVASGTKVKKGQVIAHSNTRGQGNATTPGWFEIGRWPPGSMTAGQAIRAWLIGLPRVKL